ncbi:MAG: permease, partial [Planctomycetota bacterium]
MDIALNLGLGGLLRLLEALVSAAPTLAVGLIAAAVMRFFLGIDGTRRLFGGQSLRSLPQSWLIGMLMPVCSIGVLPILLEMRRAKLKPGAMSAFALAAPLFNPLSLLYGLTLSRPYVILMYALVSLLVVTIVGLIWDRFADSQQTDAENADDEPPADAFPDRVFGTRRLAAAAIYITRQAFGPVGAWTLLAAGGVMLLTMLLPHGSLDRAMCRDDWWAPARMVLVAMPAYATPMLAMSQMGMMFQHANSPGAAFVLLAFGAGMNLGTVTWMARHFGVRSAAVWLVSLLVVVALIAYAVNRPLIPPGITPSDHTHAFDIYTSPLPLDQPDGPAIFQRLLAERIGLLEQIVGGGFLIVLLSGAIFRLTGITELSPAKAVMERAKTEATTGRFDRIISTVPTNCGLMM